MDDQQMETMMAAAIGALAAIFVFAFVGLLFICKRQHQRRVNWDRLESRGTSKRRSKKKKNGAEPELALALSDIGLGSALEQILNDEQWVDDASGLIPHCLTVLKTCHSLTERLANLAMRPLGMKGSTDRLVEAAKRVPSRVDDVVHSMYPPIDVRLLEARAAALVLSVGQLALLAQNMCGNKQNLLWIEQGLLEMDNHLVVLREAAIQMDEDNRREFFSEV